MTGLMDAELSTKRKGHAGTGTAEPQELDLHCANCGHAVASSEPLACPVCSGRVWNVRR
jgi:rubrerythrin